jgi:hypothetical protein
LLHLSKLVISISTKKVQLQSSQHSKTHNLQVVQGSIRCGRICGAEQPQKREVNDVVFYLWESRLVEWKCKPIKDRMCVFCDQNDIEIEKHILLHCSFGFLQENTSASNYDSINFWLLRFVNYITESSTTDSKFYI